jgi:hypothetical protein
LIVVVTPVRGSDPRTALVSLGFADFRSALVPLTQTRVAVTYQPVQARNELARLALLEPKMTHTLWLDDDQWADDPMIVQRMLDSREDLVGAPYTRKGYPLRFAHKGLVGAERTGDLLDVAGLGFGFTLTSRRCLEEMTAEAVRSYVDDDGKTIADLFGLLYQDDGLLSEDLSFCARWRALGGRCVLS